MRRSSYETTPTRALLGVLIGALTGGAALTAGFIGLGLINEGPGQIGGLLVIAIFSGVFGSGVFLVGLVFVGAPAWVFFHKLGWRGWPEAVALGVVLTFVVNLLLLAAPTALRSDDGRSSVGDGSGYITIGNHITDHGWIVFAKQAAMISIIGGVVGLTIWRVAYRRQSSPQLFPPP